MKAIIPAAGLGTRLLPTTKVVPKELFPVEGKPAIQWVLEEAVEAGLKEFIVVVNPGKAILRDYLTPLTNKHPLTNHSALADLENLLHSVDITFVEQSTPRGLGDAVLRCRDFIGKEPFALLLPDNICPVEAGLIGRLLEVYHAHSRSCVALLRQAYGPTLHSGAIVAQQWRDSVYQVQQVLPKGTSQSQAQVTSLRGIGRYILEPAVFTYLEQAQMEGELDDVPALDGLAQAGRLLGLLVTDKVYHLGQDMTRNQGNMDTGAFRKDTRELEAPGHVALWSLHRSLRQEIKERWQRAVPFADELFDRWERAAFLGFGPEASIYDSSLVMGDVQVGRGTWIGPFTVLDGRGGLVIGQYCSISTGVQLYSHDTVKWALTGGKALEVRQPTQIGDCCYLGPLSIVSKGVTIGKHSVIGANSFVRQDVPPFSIAVGSPARVIGRVELVGEADVRFVYDSEK